MRFGVKIGGQSGTASRGPCEWNWSCGVRKSKSGIEMKKNYLLNRIRGHGLMASVGFILAPLESISQIKIRGIKLCGLCPGQGAV